MYPESNFHAWLSDEQGLIVPGSYRHGHNVFTEHGREWLKQLVVWSSMSPDVALDERRMRWLGVGNGYWAELTNVDSINAPLTITTGPDEYLRILGTRTEPTNFSTKFVTAFAGGGPDFDHHGLSVDISEAGIFVDVHDGVGTQLDPSVSSNVPVAYKSFAPITKPAGLTLTITWEFRF